jgi:dihydropteroate synthase
MPKTYEIMGVLNANDDSFYQESRFTPSNAVFKIQTMIQEGADIIDIGAVSSRPGSQGVSETEELRRLKPILDAIYADKLYEQIEFSLDSYSPVCASYALERGFTIINDISGLENDELCALIGSYKAKVVLMHMLGKPQTMQDNPQYENLLVEVENFFKERISKAEKFGIQDIILDVGIGFGKTLEDNIKLIKEMAYFKGLKKELLIGASRKSMIDLISPSSSQERLPGTLALHLKAYDNGASIVRCHDVKEHVQAFKVHHALQQNI